MKIGDKVLDLKYSKNVIVTEVILEASKRIEGRWICEDCKIEVKEVKKTEVKEVKKKAEVKKETK